MSTLYVCALHKLKCALHKLFFFFYFIWSDTTCSGSLVHKGGGHQFNGGLRATMFSVLVPEEVYDMVLADFRFTAESRTVGLFEEVTEEVVKSIWWKNDKPFEAKKKKDVKASTKETDVMKTVWEKDNEKRKREKEKEEKEKEKELSKLTKKKEKEEAKVKTPTKRKKPAVEVSEEDEEPGHEGDFDFVLVLK